MAEFVLRVFLLNQAVALIVSSPSTSASSVTTLGDGGCSGQLTQLSSSPAVKEFDDLREAT